MASGNDIATESPWRNVYAVLVSEKVVAVLKISKARVEVWRNVAVKCLEGLFYEGVDSGSVGDVGSEGTVNNSDEHCIG